jgi:uncharacterized membrane protein YraQ (UPF0718 family)
VDPSDVIRLASLPEVAEEEPAARRPGRWRSRLASIELLAALVLLALLLRGTLVDLFSSPRASTFLTALASVLVAGLPFLVLGAAASAALRAFVPYALAERLLALPEAATVPASAAAGLVAPLSDDSVDASVPLMRRSPAVAVTFLLASSAINPVVLVATAVAFPGEPMMVLARFLAGLLASAGMGWLWLWLGRPEWLDVAVPEADSAKGWPAFWERCRLDVVRAGGFLVLGALAAAALTALLPPRWLDAIGATGFFAVVLMALLAVLLSVRGGADAFVAAAMSQFSATARLAFLVVGPTANLRLFTRAVATFGPRFALRFVPAALAVGVVCALVIGAVLL